MIKNCEAGIAFSPAGAKLHIAHAVYDVVVKGPRTHEVTLLALNHLLGNAADLLGEIYSVMGDKAKGAEVV